MGMLSGFVAFYGEELVWGINQGLADINADGGIRGKPVEVNIRDHGSNEFEKNLAVMVEVLDTDPLIIWGPTDAGTEISTPKSVEAKCLSLQMNVGESISTMFKPWSVSLIAADKQLSISAMDLWVTKYDPSLKKVVQFSSPDHVVWESFSLHQREALEGYGIEVVDVPVPIGAVNLSPFVVRALAEEPDAILFSNGEAAIARAIEELRLRGWTDNSKNCLFECAICPDLWEMPEESLNGCWAWNFFNPNADMPRAQQLLADYRAKFDIEPSFHPYKGYDAVMLTKQCFEDLKITGDPARLVEERQAISDYMADCTFNSIFGPRDIVNYTIEEPAWLFVIEGNKLTQGEVCD